MGIIGNLFYILVGFCIIFEFSKLSGSAEMRYCNTKALTANFYYALICIVGLFSSTWYCFATIILLSLLPKKNYNWCIADSVISILLLMSSIIIKYHIL